MPSVLDTAKEATYAAVGLQILAIDEMNERFADQRTQLEERFADQRTQLEERFSDQRTQLDEQLELARKHGAEARERVQPMIQRSWELAESTVTRVAEMTPAPIDGYVTESFAKIREFAGVEATEEEAPAKKAPAKKAAAKK